MDGDCGSAKIDGFEKRIRGKDAQKPNPTPVPKIISPANGAAETGKIKKDRKWKKVGKIVSRQEYWEPAAHYWIIKNESISLQRKAEQAWHGERYL